MKRARKVLLWVVGVVAAVVLIAVGAFFLTPSDTLLRYAAAKVRAETGRELTVEGPISRRLWPTIGFETGRVTLSNAPWAEQQPLFSAESVSLGVALTPLLSRRLVVEEVRLVNPTARLQVGADGRANYAFEPQIERAPSATDEPPLGGVDFSIAKAVIQDGVFIYVDDRTNQRAQVLDADLDVAFPGYDLPLTVSGAAVVNTRRARLDGEFASLGALNRGENVHADFTFAAEGALVHFDGIVLTGGPQGFREARGEIAFQLDDDPVLTDWLRQMLPPRLDLIGAVDVAGKLSASPAQLDVELSGFGDYNTVRTEIVSTASAGEGWLTGKTVADVTSSARNDYFDVGYVGEAGFTPEGGLYLDGDWRARIMDGDAFARWVDPTKPLGDVTLLQAFDVTGDIQFLKEKAAASVTGVLDYNDRRVAITGELTGGGDWRTGGEVDTFLELDAPDLVATTWTGTLTFTPAGPNVDGLLTFATHRLSTFRTWLDQHETPEFYRVFVLQGRVQGGADHVRLVDAIIRLNDIETQSTVEAIMRDPRPLIRASFSGGPFDFTPFIVEAPEPATPQVQSLSDDWSDQPFDFSALKLVDADLDIQIEGFRAAPLAFGPTKLTGTLRDGRIDAKVAEMALYGGQVKGAATLDARTVTPQVVSELQASAVRIGSMLTAFGKPDVMYGDATLDMKVAGSGRSMKQLMGSLDGSGSAQIRDGQLLVINFAEQSIEFGASLLGGEQEVPGVTPFDRVTATAVIEEGVLANRDMRFAGPVLSARGEGTADLGAKRLDYVVTPTRLGEGSFLGIDRAILSAFPVSITGPFHALRVGQDQTNNLDEVVSDARRRRRDRD